MFNNLMAEAKAIQKAWGYGLLDAVAFIHHHEKAYSPKVRRELKEFMRQCRELFA